jgi:hypothetical protein
MCAPTWTPHRPTPSYGAFLHIAEAVLEAGATDVGIRNTVLIAATFRILNRYVDGLCTTASATPPTTRRAHN